MNAERKRRGVLDDTDTLTLDVEASTRKRRKCGYQDETQHAQAADRYKTWLMIGWKFRNRIGQKYNGRQRNIRALNMSLLIGRIASVLYVMVDRFQGINEADRQNEERLEHVKR